MRVVGGGGGRRGRGVTAGGEVAEQDPRVGPADGLEQAAQLGGTLGQGAAGVGAGREA